MEVIFIHLIKSSALLLFAYLIYLFLVRLTTFHFLNRSYLLLSVCISLLLPFVHFPVEETQAVYAYTLPTIDLTTASISNDHQSNFDLSFAHIVWWLYIVVCISLTLRLMYYLGDLSNTLYKHPKKKVGDFNLIHSNSASQAFSFFKYIVIPQHIDQKDEQIIIKHEMLHANKWHSIDILFMEAVKIIFWFHPVIYLIKQEIVQQHEFEIDRLLTTRRVVDIEQYGNLLIQQAQQIPVRLSLTNNFNHSLIKNRIQMMTKPKSNKIQLLRYALLLPVLSLIGVLMAFEKQPIQPAFLEVLKTEEKQKSNITPLETKQLSQEFTLERATQTKKSNHKDIIYSKFEKPKTKIYQQITKQSGITKIDSNQTDIKDKGVVFTIVEEMPEFPGGDIALIDHFRLNMMYPEAAQSSGIQGVVVLGFTIEKDGSVTSLKLIRDIGSGCGEEAMRIARLMPKWLPGKQDGKTVRVAFKLPVRFKLDGEQENTKNNTVNPTALTEERKEALKKLFETGVTKVTYEEENPEVLSTAEQMPKFPGGDEALLNFFGSKIVYPEAAKNDQIQGIVVLSFTIEKDGSISDLIVMRDIGGDCGDEALRVAKLMPNWTPGMQDGKTVRVSYKLPVRFQLDSEELKSDE